MSEKWWSQDRFYITCTWLHHKRPSGLHIKFNLWSIDTWRPHADFKSYRMWAQTRFARAPSESGLNLILTRVRNELERISGSSIESIAGNVSTLNLSPSSHLSSPFWAFGTSLILGFIWVSSVKSIRGNCVSC